MTEQLTDGQQRHQDSDISRMRDAGGQRTDRRGDDRQLYRRRSRRRHRRCPPRERRPRAQRSAIPLPHRVSGPRGWTTTWSMSDQIEAGHQVGVDAVELPGDSRVRRPALRCRACSRPPLTAADKSLSRPVMAATNCLVSASFGFFSATRRSDCSAPAIRADSSAPCPENWPIWLSGTPSRSARRWSMKPRAVMEARYTSGTTIGASSRVTVSSRRIRRGGEQLALPGRLQLRLGHLDRGPVAVALRSKLSLERLVLCPSSALMRRASFLAASLASSFAFATMARASALRVARVLRRLNGLIPAASRSSLGAVGVVAAVQAQPYRPVAFTARARPAERSVCSDSK